MLSVRSSGWAIALAAATFAERFAGLDQRVRGVGQRLEPGAEVFAMPALSGG